MDDRRRMGRRAVLAAGAAGLLAGCLDDDDEAPTPGPTDWAAYGDLGPMNIDIEAPTEPPATDVSVEPVIEHLEIPWDLDYDSNGNLYVTERTGQLLRFDADEVETVAEPADAIDAGIAEDGWWVDGGEGGTLGVAVSPDDAYVFVYYTADDGGLHNRVSRFPIEGDGIGDEEVVIDDIPADDLVHNGGRLAFGPAGYLWVTTGDAGDESLSRSPGSIAGKLLRVDEDGEAAPDNPDHGGDDRVYAAGLRNPQGLDWIDGTWPVVTDHGPTARDAMSLVYAAGDYGWDDVRSDDDDDAYGRYSDHPEIVPPIAHSGSGHTWAPSGATWYDGDDVPSWSGRLVVGALTFQHILVVTLTPPGQEPPSGGTTHDGGFTDEAVTATVHDVLGDELGRVRHVEQGPNGELYALTSNWDGRADGGFPLETDDRVVRIVEDG